MRNGKGAHACKVEALQSVGNFYEWISVGTIYFGEFERISNCGAPRRG